MGDESARLEDEFMDDYVTDRPSCGRQNCDGCLCTDFCPDYKER